MNSETNLPLLRSLSIRNLALVESLDWEIKPGFLAVTGETGAGKSVIVGALKLVLGDRADRSLIRTGASGCTVEAVFEMRNTDELDIRLAEHGIEPCSDGQLILKRVLTAAGAGRQFINGSSTTISILKTIAEPLVDLHGPHDHQSLLSKDRQLDLLDSHADIVSTREEYATVFRSVTRLRKERDELANSESALEREIDLLRHQVREIDSANLIENEEDELMRRYTLASNTQRLTELAAQIDGRLVESDDAILPRLAETLRLFRDLERVDSSTSALGESCERAVIELEELAQSVQQYAGRLDIDPSQAAEVEERVTLLESLKRKYGNTLSDVITFGKNAFARLERIESRGSELDRLAKAIEQESEALRKVGGKLSKLRKKAAPILSREVTDQLRDLGFKKSEFEVALKIHDEPMPHGLEGVEFLFAPNPGEPPKPLRTIASSGEISRVMLAVKTSLAAQDRVPLLVFDEIDANVGGEIAHAVASKMRSLSKGHQVLCITHLPQVAAAGSSQYVVSKTFTDNRTISDLKEVSGEERVEEIARMLGGKTKSALEHARTLLAGGQ